CPVNDAGSGDQGTCPVASARIGGGVGGGRTDPDCRSTYPGASCAGGRTVARTARGARGGSQAQNRGGGENTTAGSGAGRTGGGSYEQGAGGGETTAGSGAGGPGKSRC